MKAVWIHNWMNRMKCWVSLEFLLYVTLITNKPAMNNHLAAYQKQKAPRFSPLLWSKNILCQQWMNSKWDYSCCMGFWYMLWFFLHAIKMSRAEWIRKLPAREKGCVGEFIGKSAQRKGKRFYGVLPKLLPRNTQNAKTFLFASRAGSNVRYCWSKVWFKVCRIFFFVVQQAAWNESIIHVVYLKPSLWNMTLLCVSSFSRKIYAYRNVRIERWQKYQITWKAAFSTTQPS